MWFLIPGYSQLMWSQKTDVIGFCDLYYRATTLTQPLYAKQKTTAEKHRNCFSALRLCYALNLTSPPASPTAQAAVKREQKKRL